MEQCRRCGRCCEYQIGNENKRCKFLNGIIGDHTFCSIYSNRIGTTIDKEILIKNYQGNVGDNLVRKIICGYRKDEGHNRPIEGCTELMTDNPIKRVGDTVDGTHSCTSNKYGDCLYYDYYGADGEKCVAPVGVNRLCMKQFREYKKTPAYEKWEKEYYEKMQKYLM